MEVGCRFFLFYFIKSTANLPHENTHLGSLHTTVVTTAAIADCDHGPRSAEISDMPNIGFHSGRREIPAKSRTTGTWLCTVVCWPGIPHGSVQGALSCFQTRQNNLRDDAEYSAIKIHITKCRLWNGTCTESKEGISYAKKFWLMAMLGYTTKHQV